MIKTLALKSTGLLKREMKGGGAWFVISSFMAPAVSILIGPFVLKKVGLETYATLSLAAYFSMLAGVYSDFGSYTHLLAMFSKKSSERFADLGCALLLRGCALALFFGALLFFAARHPRQDELYLFLGIFMAILFLPSVALEWYFIARGRYFHLFLLRLSLNGFLVAAVVCWCYSPWRSALFVPFMNAAAAVAASGCMAWLLGKTRIVRGFSSWKRVSFRGMYSFMARIFPLAATQLITPYFLAYSLAWFSMVTPDKAQVGAFSLSYRLVLGFSGLFAPLVFYIMPRLADPAKTIAFRKTLVLSGAFIAGAWLVSVPLLWYYFKVSKIDPALLVYSVEIAAILFLGSFFTCLRIPYVSYVTIRGHYRAYFFLHFCGCFPVLLFSWFTRARLSSEMVPWLACLPDVFATVGFVCYYKFGISKREALLAAP